MPVNRITLLVVTLALLLGFGALTASAAGPTVSADPLSAPFIDNLPHAVGANGAAWYRFHYIGNESLIAIRMSDIDDQGITFAVFAPNQVREWWKEEPMGRSNVEYHDLVWSGSTTVEGNYYVKVDNINPYDKPFTLLIQGSGVGLTAAAAPAAIAPKLGNTEPMRAALLDDKMHGIAANTSLWYKYEFPSDHRELIVRLPNGAASNLEFRVFTSDQLNDWWKADPFGVGNVVGDHLIWMTAEQPGEFIYVQVVNANPYALQFTLELMAEHVLE